jgi:hypothetical protein
MYLGEEIMAVDVRPVRAAYLIQRGSASAFVKAVSYALDRWGGLHEVIVPVSPTGRLQPGYRDLLTHLAEPDLVFDLSGLTADALHRVQEALGCPVYPKSQTTHWQRLHPLGAFTAEEIRELKVVQPLKPTLMDRAGPGYIEDETELQQWRGLGATVDDTHDRVELAIAQLHRRTLAETSGHQCHEVRIESPFSMSHIWIAHPNSLKDCLDFWIRRAIAPRGLERDCWVLTTPQTFVDPRFQSALRASLASRPHTSDPTFLLASLTVPKAKLNQLVSETGLQMKTKGSIGISYRQPVPGLPRTSIDKVTVALGIGRPSGRVWYGLRTSPTVQLFADGTRIRTASPFRSHPQVGFGPVRIRLSEAAHIQAPALPAVARLFHDHAEWVRGELEIPMSHAEILDIPIRIPTPRAILDAVVSDKGLNVSPSHPGRYAQAVLAQLASADLFLNPSVEKVISAMTASPPKRQLSDLAKRYSLSEETIDAILARLEVRHPRLERSALEIRHEAKLPLQEVLETLDELAYAGLVERGLVTECNQCAMHSFQAFPQVSPKAVCPACGARGRFAGDAKGPQLRYRLNAILDRASANGALVHLYAVAAVLMENREALILPGSDITRPDGTSAEIDLLGLVGPIVLGGEAKRRAAAFTRLQLERDVALTVEAGGTRHLMVCLEEIPKTTVEIAKKTAAAAGIDLVILCPPTNRLMVQHRRAV